MVALPVLDPVADVSLDAGEGPRLIFLVVNSANQRCILAGGGDTEGKVLC
ncbi:MAG: hypothetical protein ABSA14_15455 [Acidimicrobiales bacterium]